MHDYIHNKLFTLPTFFIFLYVFFIFIFADTFFISLCTFFIIFKHISQTKYHSLHFLYQFSHINPLSNTCSGSMQHFLGGFRKFAYFPNHLQMRAAVTFVYITQITQTTGKCFQNKVTANEIKSRYICVMLRQAQKILVPCEHNIMSDTIKELTTLNSLASDMLLQPSMGL